MRITVKALRQVIREEYDTGTKAALRRAGKDGSELDRKTSGHHDHRSSRPEKKKLSKSRRQADKALAYSIDESDWEEGDVARVGVGDETFMIDPNQEDEWDLVPGTRTLGGEESFSLDRDESGDYERPLGAEIEEFSADYSDLYDDMPDEHDLVARAQRHEALQREAIENEAWVLERSGVSWSEKFVVNYGKFGVTWGTSRKARKFTRASVKEVARRVEEYSGIHVRPSPVDMS
jgi:hypothetical protein